MSDRNMSEHDTQFRIGKFIEGDAKRDAIHIAVAPVTAAERIEPGDYIAFSTKGDSNRVYPCAREVAVGIADPFLPKTARHGDMFYMFLLPNTITSLRHQWTHPAFVASASEQWLRDFAQRYETNYSELVAGAASGEGHYFGTDIEYSDFDARSEFWTHIEAVTGKQLSEDHRENTSFRCAC